MRVGKHKERGKEWNLGDMPIKETSKYKYLGDWITDDGKNSENINARQKKLQGTTVLINTIASGEVLNKIETTSILELHEKKSISGLLTNSESWVLNKGETERLEKAEIRAFKNLFRLPIHTPTAAIIYTFGLLFTKQRIDKRQLIYLQKILLKNNDESIKKSLKILKDLQVGWAKTLAPS